VTAGLTHELNNPVAAVMSATAQLREGLVGMRSEIAKVIRSNLDASQLEGLANLVGSAIEHRRDAPDLSPLETSDREDELATWLEDHDVAGSWDVAPILVAAGLDLGWVKQLADVVPPPYLDSALVYPVRALESDALLDEITEAAGRISDLLSSAKQYTQMDRAPLQTFDVHEGLDATLTMLGHKLGDGIQVVRDYDRSLPHVSAFPGELNQVWTNLIDNALAEARERVTIRTCRSGDFLSVEVEDDGPGVPPEIAERVFDAFFTTKEPGQGTGLGLDIARRIVVRHRGDLRLKQVERGACFQVLLPLSG
jgi:signal transduction histidine kinase